MAWVAALVGAGTSYMSAREANRNQRNVGQVNLRTDTEPWRQSTPYREAAMRGAYDLLGGSYEDRPEAGFWMNGRWVHTPQQATPTGWLGRTGGAGGAAGAGAPGGGGGGGGRGGGGGNTPARNYTQELMGGLTDRAQAGHPLYGVSTNFTNTLLTGGETNPYRTQAAGAYADLQNDPTLGWWIDTLAGGGDLSGLGGAMGGYGSFRSGGGGVGSGPIRIEDYIRRELDGANLDAANPHREAMINAITGDVNRTFAQETLPGINSAFTGAGAFGSSMYERALGQAAGEHTRNLTDAVTGIRYGEYEARMADRMAAMGLGTQFDLGYIDAQQRAAASASSAAASAYGADRNAQTQMALARLGALGDAVGMGVNLRAAGAEGLGSLAGLYSSDMMGALGMVPDLTGLDIRDYDAALGHSRGIDQTNAANRARQSALNWERERYYREAPMLDLMRYIDVINAASGGYGSMFESGSDYRQVSPSRVNPWAQAAQGGLAGWYAAQNAGAGTGFGGGRSSGATFNSSGFETGDAAASLYG